MNRPHLLRDLKFNEVFSKYIMCSTKNIRRCLLAHQDEEDGFFEIFLRNHGQRMPRYLCRRSKDLPLVCLKKLPLTAGEHFYLRLLLVHTASFRWPDLLDYNGRTYGSYQLAAIARGLVKEKEEAMEAYKQYMDSSTPQELQNLFATMTLEGHPTLCIFEDIELRGKMLADYFDRGMNIQQATNELLKRLAYR
jgi:hypothetical protein